MQIEKPKAFFPWWAAVVAVIFVGLILSLPFLAGAGKETAKQTEQTESADFYEPEILPDPLVAEPEIQSEPEPEIPLDVPAPPLEVKKESLPQAVAFVKQPTSALMTSFYGDVRILSATGEKKAEKNKAILEGETIEVGATGEAVIEIAELYVLRLKPNSQMTQLEPSADRAYAGSDRVTHRFKLDRGALLGTTKYRGDKMDVLNLLVKDKVFSVQDSTFRVQLNDSDPWIGVMRGSLKSDVEQAPDQPFTLRALERVSLSEKPLEAPTQVSEAEWALLRETYEMNTKTAAEEALQLDLSKRAGDFFQYVFDHGTFYTEDVGYTVRDFYEDQDSGEVYLEAEYDVFPANSFVGLYVLTRDLDARDYGGIRFDVRRKPDEGYPDRFYVELKSKGQIIHRFEITDIKPGWETRQVDFFAPVSVPITEMTLVFLNESIGQTKKGYIQMRNIEMVPLTEDQKARRLEAEKNPAMVVGSVPKAMSSQAPKSLQQAVVTESVKQARRVMDASAQAVPYKVDESKKIANEVPKIVALDDLS